MSKNKYYVFNVSCKLTYSIEATSEKKAREVLEKHGGVDIEKVQKFPGHIMKNIHFKYDLNW